MVITNERYALVGYFITSYPTRAHGIIVVYNTDAPITRTLTIFINTNNENSKEDELYPGTRDLKKSKDQIMSPIGLSSF